MMKIILLVTLVIAVVSLLMNILMWVRINKVSQKRKELKGYLVDRVIPDVNKAFQQHNERIVNLEYKIKSFSYIPKQSEEIHKVQQSDQKATQHPVQQVIQQSVQQTVQQSVQHQAQQNDKNKSNKGKNRDKGNNKPQKPVVIKTIFLGINSDDFFFENQVDEQKSATSKFIGELTSETEGTFYPIDVERIRSANVSASVKQQGMISLKDAQTLNVIEPGVIHKVDKDWQIKNPAVVEFIK